MQGAAKNRFGFQDRVADDESASGFQFAGAWSELNSKRGHEDVRYFANVEPYLPSSRMRIMGSKIEAPPRSKTPVGGCSTNASIVPQPIEPQPIEPLKLRSGNDEDGDKRAASAKRREIEASKFTTSERSSTVASFASTGRPLLSKPFGSFSHNNLSSLVTKMSACTAACQGHAPQVTTDNSQASSCFSMQIGVHATNQMPVCAPSGNQIPKLWVDKHRPESLGLFVVNSQQAQDLKHLISGGHCHHLLFQGPPGSGKKCLIMALVRDIFGVSVWQVRDFTRNFDIEGKKISVPLTSSAHHVEVNLIHVGVYLRPVLTTLLKEMKVACTAYDNDSYGSNYKVLVLHDADKVSAEAQQHIRWLMDRYSDYCKFMLRCPQTSKISDTILSRCIPVNVRNPTVDEVVQVLYFVAKRENLELPESFARRVAKASSNFRQAVLSLEACKMNRYPFDENQPIVTEWENDIVSMARDIIDEQNPRRLYLVRGKIQKLLDDGVAPKLILWSIVQEFVKLVDIHLGEEASQWAKFYVKRIPDGIDAVFKLEEFVAKLMSLYKKFIL